MIDSDKKYGIYVKDNYKWQNFSILAQQAII